MAINNDTTTPNGQNQPEPPIPIAVAVLLFPGVDILDYAGPIEILSHASHNHNPDNPQPVFSIHTVCDNNNENVEDKASLTQPTVSTGTNTLTVQPGMSIATMMRKLDTFQVLIVPGGPPKVLERVMAQGGGSGGAEVGVIRAFAALGDGLGPGHDGGVGGGERILFSVCTGAFLLAKAGVLEGGDRAGGRMKVTTHHRALEPLRALCEAESGGAAAANTGPEVVGGKRFVDAGVVRDRLRILTAGGISSGLDATLHLVELVKGRDTADFISRVMEYERRQI